MQIFHLLQNYKHLLPHFKAMPNILRTRESVLFLETRPRESLELCSIPVGSDLGLFEWLWLLPVGW